MSFLMRYVPRKYLILLSYPFSKISGLLLRGNNVECPVCEGTFRTFLPYGAKNKRSNVLCPKCLSLERHRLIWLYLNRETDFFTVRRKMLHVAPEQCFLDRFKALKNLDYTTADIESPIADVKMDLHDIPFEENTFDVIFCNHVLEHVDNDRRCMSELYRVMRPGGFGIFQVPQDFTRAQTYEDKSITSAKDREEHFWQKDHVRLFGMDYPERLRAAGFTVDEVNMQQKLPQQEFERFRLMPGEILYIARK